MAKNKLLVSDLIDDIQSDLNTSVETKIPDIITFCNSPQWLGLPTHPTNPINLFDVQRIMLKCFYRGSIGNENLEFTEEEIKLIKDLGLVDDDHGDVLSKYYSGHIFRDLVLVWGRRSGKDFCVSIIALYEAMKLLECPGGDPYAMYELSSANPINILTVANSKSQARIAFTEIKEKLFYSEYFKDKYVKEGLTSSSIYLLTPRDKEENKELKKRGMSIRKGSVGVVVGHSNSDTLLGMGCIVLILDEVASYKTTGGASSGDRIYTALTPTVQTYCRKKYDRDKNGKIKLDPETGQKIVKERIYDGKIISISSPRAKEGKFYEMFRDSKDVPNRLAMRLSTWKVNSTHTRESLRAESNMSAVEFNMEFGAEFSGTGLESFFTEDQVQQCFTGHNLKNIDLGSPGNIYFAHLDPATSSHNYAMVILHKEYYMDRETRKSLFRIIVDHIKYWTPLKGPINPDEVMEYILGMRRRFHIGMMTYDQWASLESIIKLRKAGIPNKETRFTSSYKMTIYKELENLVNTNRLFIPYDNLLFNEMIELQRKFTASGFKILPRQDGDGVKSDDVVDCLAGASYVAIDQQVNRLPSSRTVEFGNSSANQIIWRNMQGGIYGVGTGQQVSQQLEKRASWPRYKRMK
jgi:hypothetical protein